MTENATEDKRETLKRISVSVNPDDYQHLKDLSRAFKEINRVTKKYSFVSLGAYDNQTEKKILDNWAVVSTTYMSTSKWINFFKKVNYKGDYTWFKPK